MKFAVVFSLACAVWLWADEDVDLPASHPFSESSTGIQQIDLVIKQLENTMGDIPPEVEKMAIHQIRTDSKDFSPGVTRYIQGRIETAFREKGRRKIASPPELKTLKIISTDTSIHLSNTLPTVDELWRLGDKLQIDAFLEGGCSRSEEGDVLLNLKLIKHRTSDILWSVNLIAGPNKPKPSIFDHKWTVSAPFRFYPVKEFTQEAVTINDMRLDQLSIEGGMRESITANKRLYFSIMGGASIINVTNSSGTTIDLKRFSSLHAAIRLSTVIIQKPNPDNGYWLGTYLGGRFTIPFSFSGSFPAVTAGYEAQLSKHFAVSFGIQYLPLTRRLTGTGLTSSTDGAYIVMERFAYEMDLLNYTF